MQLLKGVGSNIKTGQNKLNIKSITKEQAQQILSFIEKYRFLFVSIGMGMGIGTDMDMDMDMDSKPSPLKQIKEELERLIDEDEHTHFICPTLANLIEGEIWNIRIGYETFYVPIWHQELSYDYDIMIKTIFPKSNNNIKTISDDVNIDISSSSYCSSYFIIEGSNILNAEYHLLIDDVWESFKQQKNSITIQIDDGVSFDIPLDLIRMTYECQTIILSEMGIPLINIDDITDNNHRADVYIHLNLKRRD